MNRAYEEKIKRRKLNIIEYKKLLCKQVEEAQTKRKIDTQMQSIEKPSIYYPINVPKRIETQKRASSQLKMIIKSELDQQIKDHDIKKKQHHIEKLAELQDTIHFKRIYDDDCQNEKSYSLNRMTRYKEILIKQIKQNKAIKQLI